MLAGAGLCGLAGFLDRSRAKPGPGDRKRARQRKRKRERRRTRRQNVAGQALYPDLKTLLPSGLRFDQLQDETYVLRFTNTVWNDGEGRLELEAPTSADHEDAGELYQNLYDAPVAGKRAERKRVHGRIIYHPQHEHYHFADFASYRLLARDDEGVYQPVNDGTKTSFCIIDSDPLQSPYERRYDVCESQLQGLTPGWGDVYGAHLFEQWVVLEDGPLTDGEYGLQSTADPIGLLAEGGGAREQNNAAITYFTVDGGQIVAERGFPGR